MNKKNRKKYEQNDIMEKVLDHGKISIFVLMIYFKNYFKLI